MGTSIANTYRFFISAEAVKGDLISLNDADLARQLDRVLRLRPGDRVLMLDGTGQVYVVTLTNVGRSQVSGQIEQRELAGGEPSISVTLYIGLLRAERFEWVLQKGTELGVTSFVPVRWDRSLVSELPGAQKLTRWRRIVREAAEQSCRGRLPIVTEPQTFAQAYTLAAQSDLPLLLWEGAAGKPRPPLLRTVLRNPHKPSLSPHATSIAIMSGSEGGITPEELTMATGHGIIPVSLGARVLRAETAPIVASAAIFYEYEHDDG